jgi:hypothetical protein
MVRPRDGELGRKRKVVATFKNGQPVSGQRFQTDTCKTEARALLHSDTQLFFVTATGINFFKNPLRIGATWTRLDSSCHKIFRLLLRP